MKAPKLSNGSLKWFTLFTSSGTLICCALPILLVTFGLGASVVTLTSAMPFLIVLSAHKIWVFAFSGVMLSISGWLIFNPNRTCPIEPELATMCNHAHKWNVRLYWLSAGIWSIGFFAAFLALPLRIFLDI